MDERGERGRISGEGPDESRVVTTGPAGSGVTGGHVLCPNQAVGRLVPREAPTGAKGAQLSKTGAVPPPCGTSRGQDSRGVVVVG